MPKKLRPTVDFMAFKCHMLRVKARRDEAVSGDSDYVHDDTFSEMEEIPKEILNATDSFNVKSDEEFL